MKQRKTKHDHDRPRRYIAEDGLSEDELRRGHELRDELADLRRRQEAGEPVPCRDICVEDAYCLLISVTQEEMEVVLWMADEEIRKGTDPRYRGEDREWVADQILIDWMDASSALAERRHPGAAYKEHVRMVGQLFRRTLLSSGLDRDAALLRDAEEN
jgi:hypothetical protein